MTAVEVYWRVISPTEITRILQLENTITIDTSKTRKGTEIQFVDWNARLIMLRPSDVRHESESKDRIPSAQQTSLTLKQKHLRSSSGLAPLPNNLVFAQYKEATFVY